MNQRENHLLVSSLTHLGNEPLQINLPAASKLINNKYSGWLLLKEVFFHASSRTWHKISSWIGNSLGSKVYYAPEITSSRAHNDRK